VSIIRTVKKENYSSISNHLITNRKLSWEARGVLVYLLSKPDGWECRSYDLVNQGPAGKHIIRRILKELQENGYLHRFRESEGPGKILWVTEVYESPKINTSYRSPDITPSTMSTDDNVDGEKVGHIVSTDSSNNGSNKKLTPTAASKYFHSNIKLHTVDEADMLDVFVSVTGFSYPTSTMQSNKWLRGVRDHLEEKAFSGRIPELYRQVWDDIESRVISGELTIVHPGALTQYMYQAVRIKNGQGQLSRATQLNRLLATGLIEVSGDDEVHFIWSDSGELVDEIPDSVLDQL